MNKTILAKSVVEDLGAWAKNEPKLVKRVFELISDIHKHPFEGIGKPEALKYQYKGCWSRRITEEHRLVYEVLADRDINIISIYGHYEL